MQLRFEIPNDELKERVFGEATQKAVIGFQQKNGLKETGVLDEATAAAINKAVDTLKPSRLIVRGQIRQADGSVFVGGFVYAFDKELRTEERLGETKTDEHGRYEITYTAEQFRRVEKKSADLVVRVFSPEGNELAASEVLFNAPPDATIDIVLKPRDDSKLS